MITAFRFLAGILLIPAVLAIALGILIVCGVVIYFFISVVAGILLLL